MHFLFFGFAKFSIKIFDFYLEIDYKINTDHHLRTNTNKKCNKNLLFEVRNETAGFVYIF
ncbi:hypothetical protein DOY81_011594, partial [Sarcophaga bullata]